MTKEKLISVLYRQISQSCLQTGHLRAYTDQTWIKNRSFLFFKSLQLSLNKNHFPNSHKGNSRSKSRRIKFRTNHGRICSKLNSWLARWKALNSLEYGTRMQLVLKCTKKPLKNATNARCRTSCSRSKRIHPTGNSIE